MQKKLALSWEMLEERSSLSSLFSYDGIYIIWNPGYSNVIINCLSRYFYRVKRKKQMIILVLCIGIVSAVVIIALTIMKKKDVPKNETLIKEEEPPKDETPIKEEEPPKKVDNVVDEWLKKGMASGIKNVDYPGSYEINIYFNNEISLLGAWNANKLYSWLNSGTMYFGGRKIFTYHYDPSMEVKRELNDMLNAYEHNRLKDLTDGM